MRKAKVERNTNETRISCEVNLDGQGDYEVSTPIGFFTHMLETFSKHALVDLRITVEGDVHVDQHHTIEDTGIVLGEAMTQALADRKGIYRNGSCLYPMDEVLARCALDLSGRSVCVFSGKFEHRFVGELETTMIKEFFHAVAASLKAAVHLEVLTPGNDHHMAESVFKAFAKSLRQAVDLDARIADRIPSTKGVL
ncbi:MAG: imidazoleglycerol-phosphate dehydratase HisB [Candidatus Eisenbacteria bacterium]|uniref:Imidazoleglycerol-phosphate dehydratase n=1 Tax=Eiseniibacteriota bacterium TaxID=2212470 RepID=A0A7Y2ED37_UNCEI|nr:imidazoleglycerol-phosphate dehydratase HisB [Candidatus Eisenbacteria bacterium]